jgi:hypothetical protein
MSHQLYEKSGNPGSAYVLWPVVALPAATALAAAYGYALVYIPFGGYVNLLLLGGFVLGVAQASSAALRFAKCRSDGAARLLGLVGGVFALVASWLFFLAALVGKGTNGNALDTLRALVSEPAGSWEFVRAINVEGWYTIAGMTPSGLVLWCLWAVEAAAIVGGVYLVSRAATSGSMFCETCGLWTAVVGSKRLAVPPGVTDGNFVDQDAAGFATLADAEATATTFVRRDNLRCDACRKTSGHRFTFVVGKRDKDGKTEYDETVHPAIVLANDGAPATAGGAA